jgi:hypothetical protein
MAREGIMPRHRDLPEPDRFLARGNGRLTLNPDTRLVKVGFPLARCT